MMAPGQRARHGYAEGKKSNFITLTMGSIGVVYGDIGTSPLYAFKESIRAATEQTGITDIAIYGVVSLILWALTIIVTLKYVMIMLRADNKGEGGTLSLMALAQKALGRNMAFISILGIIGAALFYGDAVITPAISVLSAVEGLSLVTHAFDPYVVGISLVILIGLFLVQSSGTAIVGAFFGPAMTVWFLLLGFGGAMQLVDHPDILMALNPLYGVRFLIEHGMISVLTLGSVFLAVTGAEALYADLGHFGCSPIRFAWLAIAFPCLALNYLGQGALVMANPAAIENPFFFLYPEWALVPMVMMATIATVIASQAVITGAYSLTQQAVQLGLLPRFDIRATSELERGQIYIPSINWMLLLAVLLLVQLFRTSASLAAAYGIAVTGTMVISAVLAFIVAWKLWKFPVWLAAGLILPFLFIDLVFLGANLMKILEGGWLPLLVGFCLMVVMLTWRRGSALLSQRTHRDEVELDGFIQMLEKRPPNRASGTAVFLTGNVNTVPSSLLHNLKHNKVLHTQNVIMSVETANIPYVSLEDRATVKQVSDSFYVVRLRFGFMDEPNIPKAIPTLKKLGLKFDVMQTSFFLSRRMLKRATHSDMPGWQDGLFIWLARRAHDASAYFHIPSDRAVEVGTQIGI
jgi:KUP system potassium uptake protein